MARQKDELASFCQALSSGSGRFWGRCGWHAWYLGSGSGNGRNGRSSGRDDGRRCLCAAARALVCFGVCIRSAHRALDGAGINGGRSKAHIRSFLVRGIVWRRRLCFGEEEHRGGLLACPVTELGVEPAPQNDYCLRRCVLRPVRVLRLPSSAAGILIPKC